MAMLVAMFLSGAPVAVIALAGGNTATASHAPHRPGRLAAGPPPAAPRLAEPAGTAAQPANLWTGLPGRFARPAPQPPAAPQSPAMLGILAVFLLANVLIAAGLIIHWVMERKRLAAWAAEWAVFGPRWTSRR